MMELVDFRCLFLVLAMDLNQFSQMPLPGLFYNHWQILTVDWVWSVDSECEPEPPNGSEHENVILASKVLMSNQLQVIIYK